MVGADDAELLVEQPENIRGVIVNGGEFGFTTANGIAAVEAVEKRGEVIGEAGGLFDDERVDFDALPVLEGARELAQSGIGTGAAKRNWASYGHDVALGERPAWHRDLLCDPQTSGGLLIACAPGAAEDVLTLVRARGFGHARAIGTFAAGPATVTVN